MTTHNSTGRRFLKLASLSARVSTEVARHRWQQLWSPAPADEANAALYARVGQDIARTLGDMKGAVMKVGQVFSQYRDLLPPELTDALATLQKDAPPQPFANLLPRLQAAFGSDWRQSFQWIDEVPMASASMAQVHRARTPDGREVVIKVQYPGIDRAIDSDLKQLQLAFKLARVLPMRRDLLDRLFEEIRDSLAQELDYRIEANTLIAFRRFHAHHEGVIIPEVIPELSSAHVLTLSYEPGIPLAEAAERLPQAIRNQIGARLFKTLGAQLFQWGRLHCDPHPGNFAVREDGSVILYDFGCTKTFPEALKAPYRALCQAALAGDEHAVEAEMRALGARDTTQAPRLPDGFYEPWLALAQACLNSDTAVDFATYPLAEQAITLGRQSLGQWRAFQPVPDLVLINRSLGGHYWNLRQLGAQLSTRPLMQAVLSLSPEAQATA